MCLCHPRPLPSHPVTHFWHDCRSLWRRTFALGQPKFRSAYDGRRTQVCQQGEAVAREGILGLPQTVQFAPALFRDVLTAIFSSTIRGLSKGALHFFSVLSKHPSQALHRFAPRLIPILEAHPRSTNYATEQEYLSAHRRWKASLRPLKSELGDLPDEEWQRALVDILGILDGQREVVLRICSEEEGGHGWREALSVWGIWVQPDFRRRDLPWVPPPSSICNHSHQDTVTHSR